MGPTVFQSQIPCGFLVLLLDSQSFCWIPRLGSLTWGSEPSQQWENFFGIIVLQFVGCPPDGYGVWCHCDCTSPTILQFFFVFGHGVSFFDGFQDSPVDGCSTASCDFGALAGADECTFYHLEPIPSWDVFNKVSACFCASYMSSASKAFVKNLIGIFWHFTESVKRAKLVAQDYQKKKKILTNGKPEKCWLANQPQTQRPKRDLRKRQPTPDWQVASFISKGINPWGLSWATSR